MLVCTIMHLCVCVCCVWACESGCVLFSVVCVCVCPLFADVDPEVRWRRWAFAPFSFSEHDAQAFPDNPMNIHQFICMHINTALGQLNMPSLRWLFIQRFAKFLNLCKWSTETREKHTDLRTDRQKRLTVQRPDFTWRRTLITAIMTDRQRERDRSQCVCVCVTFTFIHLVEAFI